MDFNKDNYDVRRISYSEAKEWVLYKHYAHRVPMICYAFGLYESSIGGGYKCIITRSLHIRCSGIARPNHRSDGD